MKSSNRCTPIGTPPAKLPILMQQRMGPRKQSRIPALLQPNKITRSQSLRDKPSSNFSITEMVESLSSNCNTSRAAATKETTQQLLEDDICSGSTTVTATSTVNVPSCVNTLAENETSSKLGSSKFPLGNRIQRSATFKEPNAATIITSSVANQNFNSVKLNILPQTSTLHRAPSRLKMTFASLRTKYQGVSPVEEPETKKTEGYFDRVMAELDKDIQQKIETFPNVQESRGASFSASWSWLRSFKNIQQVVAAEPDAWKRLSKMEEFSMQVKSVVSLLDRIRNDFTHGPREYYETQESKDAIDRICKEMFVCKVGTRKLNFVSHGVVSYMRDTFKYEVQKQTNYQKWMSKNLTEPADIKKRNKLVAWVVDTAKTLKYAAETAHMAVHYIDAFLSIKGNKISNPAWPLLGITALHIAGKLEEVEPAKMSRLIRMSAQHFKKDEVKWMEKQILEKLKLDIYPPLAPVFVSLILLGGTLEFPTLNLRKMAMDLSMGILHRSLLNHKLYSVPPLDKARVALETAVEFIFYQYHVCAKRDMSVYSFLNSEPGLSLGTFSLDLCSETFTLRFMNRKLPPIVPLVKCVASPVRDVKA